MHYCEYYSNCRHHSLVVKTQNETYVKQGSLPVQQKSSWLYVALESLEIPQLPPPLKWRSNMYPCFLSGSVQFFVFTLPFFVSLLISSLWCGQWWGIFWLCCCLFSTIVYSSDSSLNISVQVTAGTAPAWGGALLSMSCLRHFSDTPLGSDWLCWSRSCGFLQIKLQPLGGATDSGF